MMPPLEIQISLIKICRIVAVWMLLFGFLGVVFLHSKALHSIDYEVRDEFVPPVFIVKQDEPGQVIRQQGLVDNDQGKPELIVWTKKPLMFPIIVTRTNQDKLSERPRVEFRICNPTTPEECPREISQARQEAEYILNNASIITLFESSTDLLGVLNRRDHQAMRLKKAKTRARARHNIVTISYWSPALQKHVPLGHKVPFRLEVCSNDTCPEKCPKFIDQAPHKWDDIDHLCKSSDLAVLPPVRPYGGRCDCETTCHTPQANQVNSTWPWKNQSQHEFFHLPNEKILSRRELKQCQRDRMSHSYAPRYACKTNQQPLDLPSAIFSEAMHHFLFIPEAKLMFCGVPKVGISEWLKFFRFSWGAGDYLSYPHLKNDRLEFMVQSLSLEKAEELLNDPTWTRAVFFRDPAERLLSAYLDKIVSEGYTQKAFYINQPTVLSFPEFVSLVSEKDRNCTSPRGLHPCTDAHWRPQVLTCGLDYLLPHFDFIGSFDHLSEHTRLLLQRVGLWDDFGATFKDTNNLKKDGRQVKLKCRVPPPVRGEKHAPSGFNQQGPSSAALGHATGSRNLFDSFYTPELLATVREAYALDYAIWDDMKRRPASDVANGSDLQSVQIFCRNNTIS